MNNEQEQFEVAHRILKENFSEDQIVAFKRKLKKEDSKGNRWSNSMIEKGIRLKFVCGQTGYGEIQKLVPLPSSRTLSKREENLKFSSGILHEVINFLSIKVDAMSEDERECILAIDEVSIESGLDFDQSNNVIIGKVTFPIKSNHQASNGLVFLIAGVKSRWKQVVCYHLTTALDNDEYGTAMKKEIEEHIVKLEGIKLRVCSIVCDMGPLNQKMWKEFGIGCKKNETNESLCASF